MRKFGLVFWLGLASIALGSRSWEFEGISTGRGRSIFGQPKVFARHKTPMHKAIFTQRGYIQFLRWELPVPEIEEFTFCLWFKSTNLTYFHTIFSYSKNEKERLVSSWISPFGRSIHLEIGGNEILAHPTNLEEHRWYHICESWENQNSRYALWINGRKEVEGYAAQLRGHVIPSKGDIVVGQEYTDFDKGLEAGIEGAVLGFNLVLSSAFDKSKNIYPPIGQSERNVVPLFSLGENRVPHGFNLNQGIPRSPYLDLGSEIHPGFQFGRGRQNSPRFIQNSGYNRGKKIFNERQEGAFDSTLREYLGSDEFFGGNSRGRGTVRFVRRTRRSRRSIGRIRRPGGRDPLGLQLVDLTYSHCDIGRGSPFIGGSKMLISWTRTPVKVVGGTIIKNAKSTCGNF